MSASNTINPLEELLAFFIEDSFSEQQIYRIQEILDMNVSKLSVDLIKFRLKDKLQELPNMIAVKTPDVSVIVKDLSLNQLINLTPKQLNNYRHLCVVECSQYKSLKNDITAQIAYNLLKPNQRCVFDTLHQAISSSFDENDTINGEFITVQPITVCIDSSPGTGKSFTIGALCITLTTSIVAIVYQRSLVSALKSISGLDKIYTCCKFLMTEFKMSFESAKCMFQDEAKLPEMLYKIYLLIASLKRQPQVVILDEYTVVSPWCLLLLIIGSKFRKFNLIITGDKDQHNAINKSKYHELNNYVIAKQLCDKFLQLDVQMRIEDDEYNGHILEYKGRMNSELLQKDVACNFDTIYDLFERFYQKFFAPEKLLNVVYMTQYHRNIKKHQLKMMEYLKGSREIYSCQPFKHGTHRTQLVDILIAEESPKFNNFLLLIVNVNYLWYTSNNERVVVKLLAIDEDNVIVQVLKDGEKVLLHREVLTSSRCCMATEHYEWLKSHVKTPIWQFPLRGYQITYHSAQGLTLDTEILDLDLDVMHANSIYVGLSRVHSSDQIYRLQSAKHLHNLMLTYCINDEYYYKSPVSSLLFKQLLTSILSNVKSHRNPPINVKTVNMGTFETAKPKDNVRVLKSEYAKYKYELSLKMTPLLSVGHYFINNLEIFKDKLTETQLYAKYMRYVKIKNIDVHKYKGDRDLSVHDSSVEKYDNRKCEDRKRKQPAVNNIYDIKNDNTNQTNVAKQSKTSYSCLPF